MFAVEKRCVFFEVETRFLNIFSTSFGFKRLNSLSYYVFLPGMQVMPLETPSSHISLLSTTQICCHANFAYGDPTSSTEYNRLCDNGHSKHLYQTVESEIE
jgi:hypothetical protein